MATRTRRAVFGYLTDVFGTVVSMFAVFLTTPIILAHTSDSLFGFWVTTLSILGYLALADFGIGVALTRQVVGLDVVADCDSLNRKISTAFFAFSVAGSILLLVGTALAMVLPIAFKVPVEELFQARIAFCVAILAGAFGLPLATFTSVVVGFQRMAFNNTLRTVVALVSLALTLVLLFAGVGIVAVALAQLLTVCSIGLVNGLYLRRCFPGLSIRLKHVSRTDLRELLSFGGYFQLGKLARTVAAFTDPVVLSCFLSAAVVTPYTVTAKLATIFAGGLASKLPVALFPGLTELFRNGNFVRIRAIYIKLSVTAVRLAVVTAAVIGMCNQQFVSLWVGSDRFGGAVLTAVFVVWALQDTLYHGTAAVVHASGNLRGWALFSLAEAVLNIVLSVILVTSMGMVGVALATSCAKLSTTAWYVPRQICLMIELPVRVYLWRGVLAPALRSLPGVAVTIAVAMAVPTELGWAWLVLVGGIAVLTNIACFEIVDLSRPSSASWSERVRLILSVS